MGTEKTEHPAGNEADSDSDSDSGHPSAQIMDMMRSRRLSLGGSFLPPTPEKSPVPIPGLNGNGPDLLRPTKKDAKSTLVTIGNGGESHIKKDDSSSVTTISIGENENELEEFNRAALVIQRGFKAKQKKKLSGINENGNGHLDNNVHSMTHGRSKLQPTNL